MTMTKRLTGLKEAAQKALVLNNHLLKNRRLAVTMADTKPNRALYVLVVRSLLSC